MVRLTLGCDSFQENQWPSYMWSSGAKRQDAAAGMEGPLV